MKKKILAAVLGLFVAVGAAGCSSGSKEAAGDDKWPSGPITLNCGGPAGGSTDLVSRAFAQYLSKELKVPVVVGNANSIPQIQATHDAKPDGNTILTSAMGSFLYGKLGTMNFGIESMTPVAVISEDSTFGLWTRADAPYKNIKEFVDYLKAHPGEVNMGMKTGTSTHLETVGFLKATGCTANVVDAGADAARVTALLGGQIDVTVEPYGTMKSYMDEKQAVCLGIFPAERSKQAPNLPTIKEQGVNFDFPTNFQALILPPKADPALVEKLSQACQKVEANPEYKKALNKMGVDVKVRSTQEAKDYFDKVNKILDTSVKYIK